MSTIGSVQNRQESLSARGSRALYGARAPQGLFKNRLGSFLVITLFILLMTVVKKLGDDSTQVFYSQKNTLVLSVFSRTDLDPLDYTHLKKELLSLEGVKKVLSTSPQESAEILGSNPDLGIDADWIIQSMRDTPKPNTIIPWSYDLYVDQWNDSFMTNLVEKIKSIRLGASQKNAVSKIHYDEERWILASQLFQYSQWLKATLITASIILLLLIAQSFIRVLDFTKSFLSLFKRSGTVILFGIGCALASHVLLLFLLSSTFFAESFSLKQHLGTSLGFQIGLGICASYLIHWNTQLRFRTNLS